MLFSACSFQESWRPRVVCFGDSLTQQGFDAERLGWLALLANWWERRFDIVNRGFSGYNTRWSMPLLEKLFVPGGTPTKLVTIFFGANDCVMEGFAQHVPLNEYRSNLKVMVNHVRAVHGDVKVVLITPPPIHEGRWTANREGKGGKMDRKQALTMAYAQACTEVSRDLSVPVVNAFSLLGSGDEVLASEYLNDGVHFTSAGNKAIFEAMRALVERDFPELQPDVVPMQAPHFSNVDPDDPRGSVLRSL
ncbi:unnamed protein product [Choristocarpus tenellus]